MYKGRKDNESPAEIISRQRIFAHSPILRIFAIIELRDKAEVLTMECTALLYELVGDGYLVAGDEESEGITKALKATIRWNGCAALM